MKSPSSKKAAKGPAAEQYGYLRWSRDPAIGIFSVLPLWVLYEVLWWSLALGNRQNGAEVFLIDSLQRLGPQGMTVMRVLMLGIVALAAVSLLRRHVPWVRVVLVSALEGAVYGLMLGPVTGALTFHVFGAGTTLAQNGLGAQLLGSLSAGIFEETVFRLGLLSVLALLFSRLTDGLRLSRWIAISAATVCSALLFSLCHHWGLGSEPYQPQVFLWRSVAGLLLGVLFVSRGIGVSVYTHTVHNIHFHLTH